MAEWNPLIRLNLNERTGDSSFMEPRNKGNLYDRDTREIDGTPLGTAVLLLGSAAIIYALKVSGFRFSIGVGR